MKSPSPTGRLSRMRVSLHALLLASIAFVGGRAAGQAPCFDAPFVLPLDSVPIGIATADFNGDGILDLAVADGSLAVARGVGDGTFLPAVHIGPPGQARDAYSVVTGDFDSDGDVDIAVSYNLSSLVVIFRNGGTGSFTTSTFSVIGPESLALGDFDGDGDLDLAVMRDFNAGLVNLMLNTGGTFALLTTVTVSVSNLTAMIAGDFDGNGRAEIVVSELNATTLTVLSLVGGQVTTQHIPATHLIQSLAACDVDGDGDLDIVAGDAGPSVLVNTGSGVFAPPVSYPGSGTQIIVPVDLDGNGLSDVAFVSPHYDFNYTPQAISVMTAGGGGSLLPATSYPVGHFTEGVTAGDFDGDGHMDLAATDALGCVRILLGQGNGLLEAITPIATVPNPDAIETGDLDGDGDADVVVADWNLPNVSVLLNQGGVLAAPVTYPLTAVADRIVLADLDADGDLDMALVGHVATAVFVLRNNGNGTFAPFAMYPTPFTTIDIAAGDVDGDGDVDLAILIGGSVSKLMMLLNNGAGVFTATPTQSLGSVVTGFALGDTNGDGAPDAVCSSSSAGALLLFRNSGSGMFTLQQSVNVGSSSRKVLLADLDADGDLDVGESILPDQVVICSNVNGVLQPPLMTRTGQNPGELRGADFDGDGLLDLATAGPAEAVSILRNQGSVLFDPPILRASYSTASYIAPADIDGDGYPDIVVSHGYRPSISLVHACSNQVGSFFCDGDGSATACPCGNASAVGADAGCLNSLGSGGTLRTHGYAHLGADTLVLAGGGMPSSFALYFQGTTEVNGGAGNVFGDGLRCAGGNVVRLGVELNSGGVSHYPSAGQQSVHVRGLVSSPGLRTYQVWYRNAASFCTPSTFNLTNGVRLNWVP